jgi:hypothetical protein
MTGSTEYGFTSSGVNARKCVFELLTAEIKAVNLARKINRDSIAFNSGVMQL